MKTFEECIALISKLIRRNQALIIPTIKKLEGKVERRITTMKERLKTKDSENNHSKLRTGKRETSFGNNKDNGQLIIKKFKQV